jgi:hypothetical protein
MSRSEYNSIYDELADLRFELANQARDAQEEMFLINQRLKTQEALLWAILA